MGSQTIQSDEDEQKQEIKSELLTSRSLDMNYEKENIDRKKTKRNIHKSASLTNIDLNCLLPVVDDKINTTPNIFESRAKSASILTKRKRNDKVLQILGISKSIPTDAPLQHKDSEHHIVEMIDSDDSSLCLDDEPIEEFENNTQIGYGCIKSASYDFQYLGIINNKL